LPLFGYGALVAAWIWILIVTGAILVVVLLIWGAIKAREAQRERKVRKAQRLRLEAERALAGAEQAEMSAQRAAEGVADERAEATRLAREAQARQARAEELEEISEREAQQAREHRTVAERTARRAQGVDPAAPDPGDNFEDRGSPGKLERQRESRSARALCRAPTDFQLRPRSYWQEASSARTLGESSTPSTSG
jgi:hypothetical protein